MDEQLKAALEGLGSKFETMVGALVARIDAFEKSNYETRVAALETAKAMGDHAGAGGTRKKSLGASVTSSEEFAEYAKRKGKGKLSLEIKNTILGNVTGADGGPLVVPDRQPGILPGAFRTLRVVEALPSGRTDSNFIEYVKELSYTNAAAEVSEGEQKPESALTFSLAEAPVRTIATFIKASKQILSDAAQLASYIDARLRYGVLLRLETQVVSGDGTTPNLSGMLDSGNYTVFTPETGENEFDAINRAKYLVIATDFEADTVILNPTDWGAMERRKTGTSGDGAYLSAISASYVSGGLSVSTLWGMRVVLSNTITAGTFIVLASMAVQVFEREGVVVEIFEQDSDNVQKNLLTIRAEMRAAFCVYRPAAIYSGQLIAA